MQMFFLRPTHKRDRVPVQSGRVIDWREGEAVDAPFARPTDGRDRVPEQIGHVIDRREGEAVAKGVVTEYDTIVTYSRWTTGVQILQFSMSSGGVYKRSDRQSREERMKKTGKMIQAIPRPSKYGLRCIFSDV